MGFVFGVEAERSVAPRARKSLSLKIVKHISECYASRTSPIKVRLPPSVINTRL